MRSEIALGQFLRIFPPSLLIFSSQVIFSHRIWPFFLGDWCIEEGTERDKISNKNNPRNHQYTE